MKDEFRLFIFSMIAIIFGLFFIIAAVLSSKTISLILFVAGLTTIILSIFLQFCIYTTLKDYFLKDYFKNLDNKISDDN